MVIKIITCHDVVNYGASLQALALQTYLSKLKHDVKIIDYLPSYMQMYNIWNVSPKSHLYKLSKYSSVFKLIYAFRTYLKLRATKGRIKAFKRFNSLYLNLTNHYETYEQICQNPPIADLYIAGSDQIWSTYLKNGRDAAFYLAFGNICTKRISYAASFGFSEIIGGFDCYVKSLLNNFNAISVREQTGCNIVNKLGFKSVNVLDPVFLLSKNDWLELLNIKEPIIKNKYVLVYDLFHTDNRLNKYSSLLANKYKLKIVAVNDVTETKYADININNAGPSEFVNLIYNAEYIIADSFHATAFSIIFKKQFYIFYNKANISRISDLLSNINLTERLNSNAELPNINWKNIDYHLNQKISESKNFLINNLK